MKPTLPLAKITPPHSEGIIPRKRLFRLLDSGRRFPLTWVFGPPGAGKTMLVASYFHARRLPCLWYQLDEGDGDLSTFFYYLGIAAKRVSPGKEKPPPLLTPEYAMGIPVFTRRYFEDLYSRLAPLAPSPRKKRFLVIFDNYHEVPADSLFHEAIVHGFDLIPGDLQVVILSRNEPPGPFARLLANQKIHFLGWNDLRFTSEETRLMVRAKAGKKLNEENLLAFHKKSGGWAAGLMLLIISARMRNLDYEAALGSLPREVMDYLSREVFEKTDPGTQQFLLKTVFLPSMTARMAEQLTGVAHSGKILSYLSRNQYFTEERLPSPHIYQYHPLFREFLQSKASEALSQEEIRIIQKRGAGLLQESGQAEDAAALFRDASDYEGLTRLILNQAPSLLAQGRGRTLEEWVNGLPRELQDRNAWLLYWIGTCRTPSNPAAARSCLERAFHSFQKEKDVAGTLLAWAGAVDTIFFDTDDFFLLDPWVKWLDRRMARDPSFPSPEIEARIAIGMAGALNWRFPHRKDVKTWLTRALALSRKIGDPNLQVHALSRAAYYHRFTGDLPALTAIVEEMRRIGQSAKLSPLMVMMWKYMEGTIEVLFANSYEQSLNWTKAGLEIGEKSGVYIYDHVFLTLGVYASFNIGDLDMAGQFLKKAEATLPKHKHHDVGHHHFLLAWFHLLRGDPSKALAHGEAALESTLKSGAVFPEFFCRQVLSMALYRKGRYWEALTQLSTARRLVRNWEECRLCDFLCFLTEAEFELNGRKGSNTLKPLARAMALGKEQKYKTMAFFWDRPAMTRLCQTALTAGIEVEYVQDLVRSLKLFPDKPPVELENWPWLLKVYTLGKFEIVKEGKPFHFSGKVQKKPLLLLKALVAQPRKEVREEEIADWLWPEAEGDAAHSTFKSNLSRLRKLLGMEDAIKFGEGRASLDPRYCWVDAWAFERIFDTVEAGFRKKSIRGTEKGGTGGHGREEFISLAEKAIRFYQDEFLPAEKEHPWTVSMRERLRNKFLRLIKALGESLQESEDWEKAAEYYQKALEIDDLAEEFYQLLMIAYQKLGRNAEAIQVFRHCKSRLSAVLEVNPSPKTEAIYRSMFS